MRLSPGQSIAGCRILSECGRGAYGTVYLAEDALGRQVAVKILPDSADGDYELKGLRNYISICASSPALMTVFLCGREEDTPFYVMEAADNADQIPGGKYIPDTLALRLERQKRIPPQEAFTICHELLDGLEVMHASGMIHRDIKPENIIFVKGHPCLADPGLTRNIEQTLSVAGTPGYIAPEYFSGKTTPSPASDIFALGRLLYHVVTGLPPADFPKLPEDMPVDVLYQIIRPLLRLCEPSPKKRCSTCAECRTLLPKRLETHGPILRFRDALYVRPSFRAKFLRLGVSLLPILAVVTTGADVFFHARALRRRNREARLNAVNTRIQSIESHRLGLDLQLQALGEKPLETLLAPARNELASQDPEKAEVALAQAQESLTALAEAGLPKAGAGWDECSEEWGFLRSPLGRYFLPKERLDTLRENLQLRSKELAGRDGFILGSNFSENRSYPFTFIFIAPGLFTSPLLQSTRRVNYPFWMLSKEISGTLFLDKARYAPRRNQLIQAAEFLSWNEALLCCRQFDALLRERVFIPEGYGVRPPTEEEWEYAALGGWENTPPQPRKNSPGAKCQAPEEATANALGLLGMEENLSEIVMPYPERPPQPPNAIVCRGGSYTTPMTGIAPRHVYIQDQVIMRGAGGLRPVVAPMDKDFWKRQWYRGTDIRSTVIDGQVWAGWSTCNAYGNFLRGTQLASDMGATLPEITDTARLRTIVKTAGLIEGFPFAIGIHADTDGVWKRFSDNAPVSVPSSVKYSQDNDCLVFSSRNFQACSKTMAYPSVLFCWKDEESFRRRRETFLKNASVCSFEANGRRYAVCRASCTAYMVRQLATFIGVRLPVFSSYAEIQAVAQKMPPTLTYAVSLGTCRFYMEWEQADGSLFPKECPIDAHSHEHYSMTHARAHAVLALEKGNVVENYTTDYILVELPQETQPE